MKLIGITGQSGAGKGYLAAALAKLGYIHADADKIYHELLKSNSDLKNELVRSFGNDITSNGEIDRKKLGAAVFGKKNARKLKKLNRIAHKYVCREYIKLIVSLKKENVRGLIIDAPLLIEAGLNKLCDINVLVLCDREKRIERIMKRDNIDRASAELRIDSQKDIGFYLKHCDTVFVNNGDEDVTLWALETDKRLYGDGNE